MINSVVAILDINCPSNIEINTASVSEDGYCGFSIPRDVRVGVGLSDDSNKQNILEVWKQAVDSYNEGVKKLFLLPDFEPFFISKGCYVTKEDIAEKYGEEVAENALDFSGLKGSQFHCDGKVFYMDVECVAHFTVEDMAFEYNPIKTKGDFYHDKLEKYNKLYMYEWRKNEIYSCHGLYFQFIEDKILSPQASAWECDMALDYAIQEDSWNECYEAVSQIVPKMISKGYLRKYEIVPDKSNHIWNNHSKTNNSVVFFILDADYKEDKELITAINSSLEDKWKEIQFDIIKDFSLKVAFTFLPSEYACEYTIISSKGVTSFWGPIDEPWPVCKLKCIDNDTFDRIINLINKKELEPKDIESTSLLDLIDEISSVIDCKDLSNILINLTSINSVPDTDFYCVFGYINDNGVVPFKPVFFNNIDDCIKSFESLIDISLTRWQEMSLDQIGTWISMYDEMNEFPIIEFEE